MANPHSHIYFVDFLNCNICGKTTRHYATKPAKNFTAHRFVFCEVCGSTRIQTRLPDGWVFGAKTKNEPITLITNRR